MPNDTTAARTDRFRGRHSSVCLCLAIAPLLGRLGGAADTDAVKRYRARRSEAARRTRRIIFNNDGDDHLLDGPASVEAFLAKRTTPLVGSQVDTVFYCTSRPFGVFTHDTQVGDALTMKGVFNRNRNNIVADLIQRGSDTLRTMIDFCHGHSIEVFWSMRMNDTHDAYHPADGPGYYYSRFKRAHPEYLFGTRKNRPKIGSWSAVDYAEPEVRDFLFRVFEDLCRRYDVDGIELDFFRHLVYFRTVANGGHATPEEREMMTELLRRVRAMTEREGLRRGRPILVAIRVPDSMPYCMGMGLDVERWMAEGLVDLFVAGGDFRLSPWETSTALGKKYGIPVYCDLDPSIPHSLRSPYNRNSIETYRGRAMNAWDAGAAGIYIFNVFNPRHPLWRQLGDPMALRRMDKFYFVNVTGESGYLHAGRALPGGRQHLRLPILHPRSPMRLVAAESVDVSLRVGEDLAAADPAPSVTCHLLAAVDQPPQVTLNGTRLQGDKQDGGWFDYPVRPVCVRRGNNRFAVAMSDEERGESEWDVEQVCNTRPPAPWATGRKRPGTEVAMKGDALLIADRSRERSSYCYHMYPWHVDPATLAVAEARTRILSGRSTLIVTNGVAEEEVRLHTDRIVAQHAGLSHPFDTTDAFHVYRVEIEGKDLRVLVDGKLAIDGAGKFTYPAHSSRNVIAFGASSSGTTGEALWQSVRFRSGSRALFDLLLEVDYPEL